MTYTLIAGIDLLEAVRRYGLVGRTGTVPDAAGGEAAGEPPERGIRSVRGRLPGQRLRAVCLEAS